VQGPRRFAPTAWLTAAALVLLPVMAVLQYRWLSQIGGESAARLRGVATNAGLALSRDLAFEVSRAWRARVDRDQSAPTAALVTDALVLDRSEGMGRTIRVRRWNLDTGACDASGWPPGFDGLQALARSRFEHDEGHSLAEAFRRADTALGVAPVDVTDSGPRSLVPPCAGFKEGTVLFRVDMDRLRRTLLPELVRRHLEGLQREDFRFAVVDRASGSTVYAADPADAGLVAAHPDVVVPLGITPNERGDHPPGGGLAFRGHDPRESRVAPPGRGGRPIRVDAGWVLLARHRAGSLEAAVNRLRAGNLAVSLGILALLGVAVATIGANARRAERLARQQVEFVAAVSHEMRTPVSAIDLAARNLDDGLVRDPAKVQRYGHVIRTEAGRLAETVERVLQLAALDSGRIAISLAPVDARAVAGEVVASARAAHPEAEIVLDADGDAGWIRGDAPLVRSCIQNLVGNALKYGGAPGWVRVLVGPHPRGGVAISVEDRGPGIDAADLRHVFEPFYRGRLATARRIPGNGLGLHIVKRCAERMGGQVDLRSAAGAGTTVTLHFAATEPGARA
jgi:signal transduction histidine kinase